MDQRVSSHTGGEVKRLAEELGFALCGIAEARATDYSPELRAWLAAGRHGEMDWLARNVEVREDPRELLPGARSVICVADYISHGDDHEIAEEGERPERPGRIARYAQFSDYHKVLKKRLFSMADALRQRWPDHDYRVCVDTAPVLEREHAQRAGLGWVGKHTLLLNRELGSYLLLGQIVTTLDLPADEPETDHCGSCTRCIDACPTGCITPYSVDATRCISYLTIEHRSVIDPALHGAIGDWLFGCDVCQQVCPFVNKAPRGEPPEAYERHRPALDVMDVLAWDEEDRRAAFTKSAMKRAKLPQMKRNALIVAGNRLRDTEDPALRRKIETIAADADEPELVRQTAADVLRQLNDAAELGDDPTPGGS